MKNRKKIFNISILSIFLALIIAQSYIPFLGYISLPGLPSITTIHLTVIISGILLGSGMGAIVGLGWGICSLILAYTQPADPLSLLLFQNPLIAILPRVLVGFISGSVFKPFANKKIKIQFIGATLASVLGTSINTFGVIGIGYILYENRIEKILHISGNFFLGIFYILIFNFILEIILSIIVCPTVSIILRKNLKIT